MEIDAMMLKRFVPIVAAVALSCATATATAQPQGGWGPGMMQGYQGMMGAGMMGPGMMGGMMGMMARYPDGYLAFLKTEIGITAKQEKAWGAFAKALKSQAGAMGSHWAAKHGAMMGRRGMMGQGMMGYGGGQTVPLPDRLEQRIQAEQAQIESLKALRDAAKPFYQALSDQQKAKADQLLGCMGGCWR